MDTNTATEYRNLPPSPSSPSLPPTRAVSSKMLRLRNSLQAASIRSQGVLSPLRVRPAYRPKLRDYRRSKKLPRRAQIVEARTVPVRIVNLTDAEALGAQLIENLQRRDVRPLEEAGIQSLPNLKNPKYSIEQIAGKVGKSPAYCAPRVRFMELSAPVIEAFYAEEIGVGHRRQADRRSRHPALCQNAARRQQDSPSRRPDVRRRYRGHRSQTQAGLAAREKARNASKPEPRPVAKARGLA